MAHIRKILAAVDASPPSLAALSHAVNLAEDLGATLTILHVRATDQFEIGSTTPTAVGSENGTSKKLAESVTAAGDVLGNRVKLRLVDGDPIQRILEVTEAEEPDVVVMGTHGRVGRLHSLIGSVAEAVVRNSPCPVLTVRELGGEDESFAERVHGRQRIATRKPSSV